jgi:hypothetical protein
MIFVLQRGIVFWILPLALAPPLKWEWDFHWFQKKPKNSSMNWSAVIHPIG